jgi:hypothetical protein
MNILHTESTKIITQYISGTARNFFLGSGLCYTIQNEKYWDIPVLFIFPTIYAGYNTFKNKDNIIKYINQNSGLNIRFKYS